MRTVIHVLRRAQTSHKLGYSKTAKADGAAAVSGAIIATFYGYLVLSSLGSGGVCLVDLTVLLWYISLVGSIVFLHWRLATV